MKRFLGIAIAVGVFAALSNGAGEARADSLSATSTYHQIHRDLRRCVFPLCGGYFVRRVNHRLTRCANGVYRAACYVAEADWSPLGLSDDELSDRKSVV